MEAVGAPSPRAATTSGAGVLGADSAGALVRVPAGFLAPSSQSDAIRYSVELTRQFPIHSDLQTLLHTQGGLAVDGDARVRSRRGERLPNLFAAGGAAAGVSGPHAGGYLSGNGLLTATVLGRVAGESAAALVSRAG
jgi:FAD binding domain